MNSRGAVVAESKIVALGKAVLFLATVQTFQWALYGPIKNYLEPTIKEALRPVLDEYTSYSAFAGLVNAAFCLFLTALLMKVVERKKFADIGFCWTAPGRERFWQGIGIGFLPGIVVALPLVIFGLAEATATSSWRTVPLATIEAFAFILVSCGYAFQALLRQFNPIAAIAFMALTSNLVGRIASVHHYGWHSGVVLYWVISSTEVALYLCGFWKSGSLWLPFGLACGLDFAPTGYAFMFLHWSSVPGTIWHSTVWSLQGAPHLVILLVCGALLWRAGKPPKVLFASLHESDSSASRQTWVPKSFFVASWMLGCGTALILILAVISGLIGGKFAPSDTLAQYEVSDLYKAAVVPLLFSGVVFLILVYRMWASIQDGHARSMPGRAVGFLFIPFFSLYWVFQVIPGFATDYNNFIARQSLNLPKLERNLFTAYVVLCFTTWIPFLNVLTCIAAYIVGIVMINRICDAVNALRHEASPAVT